MTDQQELGQAVQKRNFEFFTQTKTTEPLTKPTSVFDIVEPTSSVRQQTLSPVPVQSTAETSYQAKRSSFRLFTILVALYLTLFVAALDQTIISTAIPTITSSLSSASGYTWIGAAYLIANAAAGPIWTKLSDIWGRKPMLLSSVAFFFSASIVCAEATSMKMLIVGRAFQGTAAGGMLSLVIVTISDLFSMRRRALWLGILEVMWAIAGGTGPVLGGIFAQDLSWRWIFWINLPVCGTTFFLLLLFLDVHNPKTRMVDGLKAIDWAGSLSILAVTLMVLLGFDFGGETFPWTSPKVICLLVFGSFAILIFIFSEKRFAKYPLMPLFLFKNRSNVAALVVTLIHGIVFIAGEYYLPLFIQSTRGADPIYSGILVLPLNLAEAIAGILCGILMHHFHTHKEPILCGTLLMTLGTGLYINLDWSSPITKLILFELLGGFGIGLLFNPPIIAIQNEVPQEHVATATSTQAFVRTMANAIGVVIGGIIFEHSMTERYSDLVRAGLPENLLTSLSGEKAAANVGLVRIIHDAKQAQAVKAAFAHSLRNMFIFYTCCAVLAVIAAFFVRGSRLSEVHQETRTGLLTYSKDNDKARASTGDGIVGER
ncbi:uncharacterized protein PV09_00836 [Verruconis gallopava]|uniref:Major facilitator superfamily (MFS) profile domain-containing protein n=1 Tax=Verruconis gallopava TaxID=253628 RepID=A0A0D2AQI0_9PEZI|nr:uncharacterized protein PV09_00836 [Verruconis gallopava]KIW08918.1 hypothetical protein PV09_00836 [Verruconis gallopava]